MPKFKRKILKNQRKQQNKTNLPLIIVISGIGILLIGLFFAFQKKPTNFTPEVTGRPSLKTDKEMVDLGNVKLGQTVSVSFELKNVGDEPLRFSNIPYVEVKEGC